MESEGQPCPELKFRQLVPRDREAPYLPDTESRNSTQTAVKQYLK
jgi:hypothetical protein